MVQRISLVALAPLLGLLLSFTNTFLTKAQSFTPVTTWGSTSAFVEGKALYIQGGVNSNDDTTPQSYSIDLSTAWSTSSPAYKKLPNSVNDYLYPATLLNDNSTLYMISNGTHYYYDVLTGDLTQLITANNINGTNSGIKGVTDPSTGIVYVPNGYYGPQDKAASLLKFSPSSKTSTSGAMPPALLNILMYAVSWSNSLGTFLVHGGRTQGANNINDMKNALFRYNITDGSWTSVVTTGQVPSARIAACMVQAYGGTKMVLFGGDAVGQVSQQSIYILDVATWVWTKGADAGAANARGSPACAVTNDMFVAQGGWIRDPNAGLTKNPTIVYNLKTGAWVSRFDPASSGGSESESGTGTGSGSGSGSNLGAIIGGVAAGVVVICGLAFWGYRSRKAKNTSKHDQPENNEHKPPTHSSPDGSGPIQPMPAPMYQQPATVAPNMQAVYTPQHQQPLQQSSSLPPVPVPVSVNNYHQLPQPTAYQIPIVNRPESYPPPQQQQQQQLHHHHQPSQLEQQQQQQQYQAQYEQHLQQQQLQQLQQQELGKQRIKDSQLQQERALAQQIEAQMAQLQMMKDQRAASEAGSHNAQQRYVGAPQVPFSDVQAHVSSGYDGSYVRPVSTSSPVDVAKPTHTSPPHRANPQYVQSVASSGYADEYSGPRNPQMQG
ncbi:hypothetical protein BGZ59_011672 [Podila verticillata]|nr:hypothetical protein BGZ59_011672 [Podila verticillata]